MSSQELLPIRIDESRMGGIIRILSWHNEGEPDQKGTTYHGLAGPSIYPHHLIGVKNQSQRPAASEVGSLQLKSTLHL